MSLDKPEGYCGACDDWYRDFESHVESDEHRQKVRSTQTSGRTSFRRAVKRVTG